MFKAEKFVILLIVFILFPFSSCREDKKSDSINLPPPIEVKKFIYPSLPKQLEFCGQTIELTNFDVRERLDKELIINTFYHSSTIQSFKRANRYFKSISEELNRQNIPDDFKYLCLIESGLTQAKSPAGAKGFWQFMPQTAKEYHLIINNEVDERYDVPKSTVAACQYLKEAYDKFGDWVLAAASYNSGMGAIQSELNEQGVSSYFDLFLSEETSRYIFRILALKIIFENERKYGFNRDDLELYEEYQTRAILVKENISNLKKWSLEQGSNYRMLKLLNPWIISNSLTIKTGDSFIIQLPK